MSDEFFQGEKAKYRSLHTIGNLGQYGQAYLCLDPTGQEVVVKKLHAGAPPDGPEVLEREATTLERVAAVEVQANVQYAVRLLDRGRDAMGQLRFIVMEQATGKNVLDDLVAPITDWQRAPLDEFLVLAIAWHFSRALALVHHAGLTYDDMKLDNLFWQPEQKQLRIIDWNVVRESEGRATAVPGDWARFGARLYELYTGERIGLSREAVVTGTGPGGPVWTALPDGVRAFITKALALGYADDNLVLNDLKRESDLLTLERKGDVQELIRKASVAEGQPQADAVAILAPVARVERRLRKEPQTPGIAQLLARCATLRSLAEAHQGRAAEGSFQKGLAQLSKQDFPAAKEVFEKAYKAAHELDPRPRRGLWLVQLAQEHRDLYQGGVQSDLERAVTLLNEEKYEEAAGLLDRWKIEVPPYQWLMFETAVRVDVQAGRLAEAIARLSTPEGTQLYERWTDLREFAADLIRRRTADEARRRAETEDRDLREKADQALAEARRAEVADAPHLAIERYRVALTAMGQLSLPDEEYLRWLKRHLGQLSRQQELQAIERLAQTLDASNPDGLKQLAQAANAALPDIPSVLASLLQQGRRLAEQAKEEAAAQILAEGKRLVENTLIQGLASYKEDLRITVQTQTVTLGQRLGEIKDQVEGQTRVLDEKLDAIKAPVVATGRSVEINELNRLIDAGVLGEALQKYNELQSKFNGDNQALTKAYQRILEQQNSAYTQIEAYRQAIKQWDWREAADGFVAAIRYESDQPSYYAALAMTYPAVARCLVAALKPQQGQMSLLEEVAQTGPLFGMLSTLNNVLKEVFANKHTPVGIRETSVRPHVERLMKIGSFLKVLGQMRTKDEIALATTRFDDMHDEDRRSMDQIASVMLRRQSGLTRR